MTDNVQTNGIEQRRRIVWLTGVPGAGKTTIARAVAARLSEVGCAAVILDGDELRKGLCADLGFSESDRVENVRRVGEMAKLLFDQGFVVLCALVSPYRLSRDRARGLFPPGAFLETFVTADLETCRARDPKGLYARASGGQLRDLTGVSAPYEEPLAAELTIDTVQVSIDTAARMVMDRLASDRETRS